jgi:hypothetical protein
MPTNPTRTASAESAALMGTLGEVRPEASTACSAWSVHDIVAHLAAGAKDTPISSNTACRAVPSGLPAALRSANCRSGPSTTTRS